MKKKKGDAEKLDKLLKAESSKIKKRILKVVKNTKDKNFKQQRKRVQKVKKLFDMADEMMSSGIDIDYLITGKRKGKKK